MHPTLTIRHPSNEFRHFCLLFWLYNDLTEFVLLDVDTLSYFFQCEQIENNINWGKWRFFDWLNIKHDQSRVSIKHDEWNELFFLNHDCGFCVGRISNLRCLLSTRNVSLSLSLSRKDWQNIFYRDWHISQRTLRNRCYAACYCIPIAKQQFN